MSADPRHRAPHRDVDVKADEILIDAMLMSLSPGEIEAQERRIVRALNGIADRAVGTDDPALRMMETDGSGESGARSRPRWSALGGIGAGLAAMLAVALILLARPGEAQASAASWFARAEAAASDAAKAVRGYLIDITPHESAPDPRSLHGRLALREVEGSGPLIRLDIDEPDDRRHSIGIDSVGGWHRRSDGSVREFPGHSIHERLVIPGIDLLLDPLPGFYDRIQRHYEVVEIVESPQPRLVARHRDLAARNPRVPDRIEIVLDSDDWSLESLVLGWDEPMKPSRQAGRQPGSGDLNERGRHRRPPGPPPGAGSRPGPRPDGPPSHGRPGPPRGRMAPPPPQEIRITRLDREAPFSVGR